jgi:DNA repair protein RecO (recombination protein O)
MQVKTKAIVISSIKYQEKSLIVKCFTLSHGLSPILFAMLLQGENQIKNRLFSTSYYFRNRGSTQEQRHLEHLKLK